MLPRFQQYTISRDPQWYEAWPDVTLAPDGRLVCIFSECTHHCNRLYTRIMLSDSFDRGRSWSPKRPLTEGTEGLDYFYNCPRLSTLSDGRLVAVVDRISRKGEDHAEGVVNCLYLSSDNGCSWAPPQVLPLHGIVPDKVRELPDGRLVLAAHRKHEGFLSEFLVYSDDGGSSWSPEVLMAHQDGLQLCEACLMPLGEGRLAAFLRENSGTGRDCYKTLSLDNGRTWSPLTALPLPGCHRPVAGRLRDGRVLVTYRFHQGGGCGMGSGTQNFFGAILNAEAPLAQRRSDVTARIFPIDYDLSPNGDLGYSGWVQFEDGEVYIVNYIVDDAVDKGQIRGYSFHPSQLLQPDAICTKCACCNCPAECKRKR